MPIILSVVPSKSTRLRTLLHFYREVCPKHDEDGKLRKEMILAVCVLIFFVLHIYRRTYSQPFSGATRNDCGSSFLPTAQLLDVHLSPGHASASRNIPTSILAAQHTASSKQYPEKPNSSNPLTAPSVPTSSVNIPTYVVQPCLFFRPFIANAHLSFLYAWESSYLCHQLS